MLPRRTVCGCYIDYTAVKERSIPLVPGKSLQEQQREADRKYSYVRSIFDVAAGTNPVDPN